MNRFLRKNLLLVITLAVLAGVLAAASQGISARVRCTLGAPVSRRYSHSPRPEPR